MGRNKTYNKLLLLFEQTQGDRAVPPFLCWKASPPTWEIRELHQGSCGWKQQLFILCIHIQASKVLNSQTSYRN